jgi:hypothetical protein
MHEWWLQGRFWSGCGGNIVEIQVAKGPPTECRMGGSRAASGGGAARRTRKRDDGAASKHVKIACFWAVEFLFAQQNADWG